MKDRLVGVEQRDVIGIVFIHLGKFVEHVPLVVVVSKMKRAVWFQPNAGLFGDFAPDLAAPQSSSETGSRFLSIGQSKPKLRTDAPIENCSRSNKTTRSRFLQRCQRMRRAYDSSANDGDICGLFCTYCLWGLLLAGKSTHSMVIQ